MDRAGEPPLYQLLYDYAFLPEVQAAEQRVRILLWLRHMEFSSFQLRLLLGHLNMRRKDHSNALKNYEQVVEIYAPIRDHLQTLGADKTEPRAFFDALVSSKDPAEVDPDLPAFAVDLLAKDDQIGRAVGARRALDKQESDLRYSRDLVDLVGPALLSGTEGIGTFRQGRAAISAVQGDELKLRVDITDFELAWLEAEVASGSQQRLISLRERWSVLVGRTGQVRTIETAATERQSAHETQVREVQHKAFQVQQIALDQVARITATRRRLRENSSGLSPQEIGRLRSTLDQLQSDLRDQLEGLERAQSEAARRRVLSSVPTRVTVDTGAQRTLIGADLGQLHADLVTMRTQVGAPADVYPRVDALWSQSEGFARRARQTMVKLVRAESAELAIMRKKLAVEMDHMTAIGTDLDGVSTRMDALADGITRAGIGRVEDAFDDTVMGADRGIVDVYWVKKGNATAEKDRLNAEKSKRRSELEQRFRVIDSRLDQAGVGGGQ
jgi:hypothetical protein